MKKLTLLTLTGVLSASLMNVALAAGFSGTWVNADPNTRGVTKMTISEGKASSKLHLWGSCHPSDCDWGAIKADNFSANVSSTDTKAVLGVYKQGHADSYVTVTKRGKQYLTLQVFTKFKDRSGRSNYRNVYTFKRQ